MPQTLQKLPLRTEHSFFSEAKKIRFPFFLVYWRKNPNNVIRLAVTVTKKNSPLSSQRNKIKRRLRPVFQNKLAHCNSGDFFVVGFNKVLQLSHAELQKEVEKNLQYVR